MMVIIEVINDGCCCCGCHNSFLGHPKSFFLFFKKNKKLHGAVLNGTVQLLLPCKCRDRGEEDFWNFSRYSSLLSLHPTCPKIPHDPYPHLHNHTLQLPRHHALHLDRVWWTSPPAAYKYRGENRTRRRGGQFFWEREERTEGKGKILEKERRVDEQRGEDKKREDKFFGEQREASCRNGEEKGRKKRKRRTEREGKGKPNVGLFFEIQRRGKEQDRRGKRRATVAPPPAPPSFLPATTSSPTIPPPSALPTPAEPKREKRNRTE